MSVKTWAQVAGSGPMVSLHIQVGQRTSHGPSGQEDAPHPPATPFLHTQCISVHRPEKSRRSSSFISQEAPRQNSRHCPCPPEAMARRGGQGTPGTGHRSPHMGDQQFPGQLQRVPDTVGGRGKAKETKRDQPLRTEPPLGQGWDPLEPC